MNYRAANRVYPLMLSLLAAAMLGCSSGSTYPPTSPEGLSLIETKNVDAVYWREGATLAPYQRVNIDEVQVAFKKNWQRDQNQSRVDLTRRVSAKDMESIKSTLAQEFKRVFAETLEKGGYEVVDTVDHDVLLLRPAIINLDITAPDVMSPGRSVTYTTEAGEMTLVLEMIDAASGQLIGRAIDRRRANSGAIMTRTNSITNRSDAIVILSGWARQLVNALDQAHRTESAG